MLGLPALSPTMEQGNISKWKKKEGDRIKPGDIIAEIETDKATVDFEATEEGFLAKIIYPAGSRDLQVGKAIAVVVENESDIGAFKDFKAEGGAAPSAPAPKKEAPPQPQAQAPPPPIQRQAQQQPQQIDVSNVVPGAPPPPSPFAPKSGVFASPLAKATAAHAGIDLRSVGQGSGPGGRIIADDLAGRQPMAATSAPSAVEGQQYTDISNSQIRRVIAQRLTQSKQTIPHYYLTIDCRVDDLLRLRSHLNDQAKGQFKLSVNDFVVKAAALTLKKVPEANSTWSDQAIRRYHNIDINVAVNTDKGLFTPFVPNADKIGLASINSIVKELADKAKENKLSPAQMTGGTFTISNLGMFGIKSFAAVINPPQACILAVGTTEQRVIVDEKKTQATPNTTQFTTANFMSVTLSCDHRVVDGAIGARWLQSFKEYIEDPTKMLL